MKKSDCGIKLKKAENGGMDRAWIWRFWGAPVFCPEVPKPFKISTWGLLDLVAHDCGYPLSRYTCRAARVAADFLDFIAFCRCSTGVALHPLKISVSHPPPPVPGGVAPKFGSEKVSRYTGVSQLQLRVSRYTVQLSLWTENRGAPGTAKFNHDRSNPQCSQKTVCYL